MNTPRLVALDMDGTLLITGGDIPQSFWPVLTQSREQGMTIAPASGRQLATLRDMFAQDAPDTFIAENGAVVWHEGEVVSTTPMPEAPVRRLVEALEDAPFTAYAVVCAPEVCFTRQDLPTEISDEINNYYHSRKELASLIDAPLNATVKLALYIQGDAETEALDWVKDRVPELRVLLSSKHWIDIMHPDADKGRALEALAETLGVDAADTAAIGDYLNDLGMLQAAGHAVAMGNAHGDVKAIADEVCGTVAEEGAVVKLREWLA